MVMLFHAVNFCLVVGVVEITVIENTFVQSGKRHRLENPGKVVLEVIEVQLGEYLAENDIVRFEDDFGRGWVYCSYTFL